MSLSIGQKLSCFSSFSFVYYRVSQKTRNPNTTSKSHNSVKTQYFWTARFFWFLKRSKILSFKRVGILWNSIRVAFFFWDTRYLLNWKKIVAAFGNMLRIFFLFHIKNTVSQHIIFLPHCGHFLVGKCDEKEDCCCLMFQMSHFVEMYLKCHTLPKCVQETLLSVWLILPPIQKSAFHISVSLHFLPPI